MLRDDVIDALKAAPVAGWTWATMQGISFGQLVTFMGGLYTLIVAVEKFYKVAQWAAKKLKKPPEG